jgi:phospho-acceptor domain-containing protein
MSYDATPMSHCIWGIRLHPTGSPQHSHTNLHIHTYTRDGTTLSVHTCTHTFPPTRTRARTHPRNLTPVHRRNTHSRTPPTHARTHTLSQAESASQRKMEFVSRVSHELRTPLNGVVGTLQLLEVCVLTRGSLLPCAALHSRWYCRRLLRGCGDVCVCVCVCVENKP